MNKVSVIIPNKNNGDKLAHCINSCLVQKEFLEEIIVVDDHSTDESRLVVEEYVKNYPDLVKLYSSPFKGANEARNFGFSVSKGAYIQWLDSDDVILPGKFEAQIRVLKDSNADVTYSDWNLIEYFTDGRKRQSIHRKAEYDDFLYEIIKDNWNPPHTYLFSRKVASYLNDNNGWNVVTKVCQDREYVTKAAIRGFQFVHTTGCFANYYKYSKKSISTSLSFKDRLIHNVLLEHSFFKLIEKSSLADKSKYLNVLNSQMLAAFYYNRGIPVIRKFNIKEMDFSVLNSKLRIIAPMLYFMLYLKFDQ